VVKSKKNKGKLGFLSLTIFETIETKNKIKVDISPNDFMVRFLIKKFPVT